MTTPHTLNPHTILVCGGREYFDITYLWATLDRERARHPFTLLIHGGCQTWCPIYKTWVGADHLSGLWAKERNIPTRVFPADWSTHGRSAGPKRNRLMFDTCLPSRVIAFPGGRGTADMVAYARSQGATIIHA